MIGRLTMYRMLVLPVLLMGCTSSDIPAPPVNSDSLQVLLDEAAASGDLPGILLALDGPDWSAPWVGAAGVAQLGGPALHPDAPVRIASNTKTFVAAALLRLWEEGRVQLDNPIDEYLELAERQSLESDGYDVEAITIRHLLTHTAGIFDHAQSQSYFDAVFSNPTNVWTPQAQIQGAVDWGDPLWPAEEGYSYSDTGYVILGLIISRIAEQPLGEAVAELIDYDGLGLASTWWETVESMPENAQPRAHQYLGEMDTYDFHPSLDLHGGGGLVASMGDLARFWRALFEHEVYVQPATLDTMLTSPIGMGEQGYGMGVFKRVVAGYTAYEHSGFWGTEALYIPALDLVVTGAVTQQESFGILSSTIQDAIHLVAADLE